MTANRAARRCRRQVGTGGATARARPGARKPAARGARAAARAGTWAGVLAITLLAASGAMAADVSGVYVAGAGEGAEADALHLRWADDEVVGRFVTQERAYLLEGWLEEPGYMGLLFDPAAPEQGLLYFVAAPVAEGMKFSLFAMPESGEMDLERPLRTYELRRAPGRAPELPAELLASLGGADGDAGEGAANGDGAAPATGMPLEMDAAPQRDIQGGAAAGRANATDAAGAGPFHGPFHGGDGRGGQALLELVQQGERVRGELMAFGAFAQLDGAVQGNVVEGRLSAVDATGTFKGTLSGPKLELTCVLRGESGEVTVPLRLERGAPRQMGERDPRLVGTWVKSSSYTSGDFSAATSQTCVIRADGTLTLYGSRVIGGGDAGSFDSGSSGQGETRRWHTQGNLLYVNGQLHARFGFSGNTLGLWFSENGKPEIWSRQ